MAAPRSHTSAAVAMKERREVRPTPLPPDAQEEAALDRAANALAKFRNAPASRSEAAVVISEWIICRTSMAARQRVGAHLQFNLGDARLRGFLEAALPSIGAGVAHLPADVSFFELDKDHIIDLFLAGIQGAQEAAVAANESLGFPFDDEIPF